MPYLTPDLWIAGCELLVNLDGEHWNNVCERWLEIVLLFVVGL